MANIKQRRRSGALAAQVRRQENQASQASAMARAARGVAKLARQKGNAKSRKSKVRY